MKWTVNAITISRIILSCSLLFLKPLSLLFTIVYIICGTSDILDGFIARRTKNNSTFGAKLDSLADIIMAAVLLLVFFPIINPSKQLVIWIVLIAFIRLASISIALKKYKTFASLHTYGNKITGLTIFIFPLLFPYLPVKQLLFTVCIMASISAVEELIIQLTSKQLVIDTPGLFIKAKK